MRPKSAKRPTTTTTWGYRRFETHRNRRHLKTPASTNATVWVVQTILSRRPAGLPNISSSLVVEGDQDGHACSVRPDLPKQLPCQTHLDQTSIAMKGNLTEPKIKIKSKAYKLKPDPREAGTTSRFDHEAPSNRKKLPLPGQEVSNLPTAKLGYGVPVRHRRVDQTGTPTRSWPWVPTMRALTKSPTL